jgi:ribosomal protein S18 acetylase RimI-like enzyme
MLRPVTTPVDIRAVADLAQRIWTEHYTPIIGAAQVAYMLERFQTAGAIGRQIGEEGVRYWLCIEAGEPVGYLAVQPRPGAGAGAGELFLSKLYVRKDCRGRGLARAMVAHAADLARELGLPRLRLTVNRHNTGAHAAYAALGFVRTAAQRFDIGGGFVMDDYVYEMAVPPAPAGGERRG